MPTRKAHARWEGSVEEGKGQVDFGNGAFKAPYFFTSRFGDGAGTNPEELLGVAHASCFAMALSLILGEAGLKPDYVDATAHVIGIAAGRRIQDHASIPYTGDSHRGRPPGCRRPHAADSA
jgi:OsmC subfamily peroxiredoxin